MIKKRFPKYTGKIIKFLDSTGITSNKTIKNDFVNYIFEQYKSLATPTIDLINTTIIEKRKSLLYQAFVESEPQSKTINSFRTWVEKTDIKTNIKNKDTYDKMFNPDEDLKPLHILLYGNKFVALDIVCLAEMAELTYDYYSNDNIDIHVYREKNENIDIEHTMKIINLMRKITKSTKKLNLIILLSNQKKYYFEGKKIVKVENMNSGFSFDNIVCVFRKEELYKVLIHELIHCFDFDFCHNDSTEIEHILYSVINIGGNDVVNEAYTEMMTLIINSVIKSIEYEMTFDQIINYEIIFTHFQIAKIINFYDGKEYDDLFNIKIKQNTSMSSYIIVKGMLLNNLEHFLNYCDKLYSKHENHYERYINLYKNVVNKSGLNENMINKFLKYIKSTDKSFVFLTLRMTMM